MIVVFVKKLIIFLTWKNSWWFKMLSKIEVDLPAELLSKETVSLTSVAFTGN